MASGAKNKGLFGQGLKIAKDLAHVSSPLYTEHISILQVNADKITFATT